MRHVWLFLFPLLWAATVHAQADCESLKSLCRQESETDCVGWGAIAAERCEDGDPAACKDLLTLAKEGWPDAQYRLGMAFATGWGFRPSIDLAKVWMREAADQDHPWARAWLEQEPEAINGAFGFNLGDEFVPPNGAQPERTTRGLRYRVTPARPVHPFVDYFVVTTPKTHLIHSIEAEAELEKYPAQQQFAYAHLRMQKEYWNQPYETRRIYQAQADFVTREGRAARLSCRFHTVYVEYFDAFLRDQGIEEGKEE